MSYQFIPNPFPQTLTEDGKGWEGITPDGRRCRVFVYQSDYVIQFPDCRNIKGESKPLEFMISKDGAMVLLFLIGLHFGVELTTHDDKPLYTDVG